MEVVKRAKIPSLVEEDRNFDGLDEGENGEIGKVLSVFLLL
jgi:hypothetical protein